MQKLATPEVAQRWATGQNDTIKQYIIKRPLNVALVFT